MPITPGCTSGMNSPETIEWHRRASMALDSYSSLEQARIERSLKRLIGRPAGAQHVIARRISSDEPFYVARVAPGIRAIFRKTGGGILVEDVVRRETLDSFAKNTPVRRRVLPFNRRVYGRTRFKSSDAAPSKPVAER